MASLLGQPAFRSIPAPAGTKVAHPIGRVGPRRGGGYLAEEGENALVLLKELGDGEAATLDAPQRVEEQVSVKGALALLRPHVDLLLMVGEGAVIPVLTVLLVYHVCKEATATFRQAGGQPVGPPATPRGHSTTQLHPGSCKCKCRGRRRSWGTSFPNYIYRCSTVRMEEKWHVWRIPRLYLSPRGFLMHMAGGFENLGIS